MNGLMDAVRDDAQKWPGSQQNLSRDLFGSDTALRHKIIGYKRSVLGLEDAMGVMEMTGGRATIHEMARQLGGVFLQLPDTAVDVESSDLQMECHKLFASLTGLLNEITASVANDGKIDGREWHRIERKRQLAVTKMSRYLALNFMLYGTKEVADRVRTRGRA